MQKFDGAVTRMHVITPTELLKKINEWRRQQPDNPTRSEAVRQLIERGLKPERRR